MGLSRNTYTYAGGAKTFAVSFADGFIERDHVRLYRVGDVDGLGDQIYLTFTWNSDAEVLVSDALTAGDQVVVERVVPKTGLIEDLESPGALTRQNIERNDRQALHVAHEALDNVTAATSPDVTITRGESHVYVQVGDGAAGDIPAASGLLAGAMAAADRVKLNSIATGAQVNPTAAEIKLAYEALPNTNAFTDIEQFKLANIEDGAEANPSAAEIKGAYESNSNTNAFTDVEKTKLTGIEPNATADQTGAELVSSIDAELGGTDWRLGGVVADVDLSVNRTSTSVTVVNSGGSDATLPAATSTLGGVLTASDKLKLDGIEPNATADQSDAEIEAAYNNRVGQVSSGEITAGAETAIRRFSPANVAAMAAAHGGGGGSMAFASRSSAVAWIAANTPTDGYLVSWPAATVVADSTASMIPDMTGFKPSGTWTPQHFGDITGTNDSATIQAMFDAAGNNQTFLFPRVYYDIDTTIDADINYRYVFAHGAWFNVSVNGPAFDLNPIADAGNITGTVRNYGYWYGGRFTSDNASATSTAALKFYGIRQMTVKDIVIGQPSNAYMKYGLMISALGAHDIENVRYIYTQIGIYCPFFATGVNGAVTTSVFKNNQFLLDPSSTQTCAYVDCGWNRWTFVGGFANGTKGNLFHFTTRNEASNLMFVGFGFEQAVAGGKFVYIQDTGTNVIGAANVTFDGCRMAGNPSGATHVHVDLERTRRIVFRSTHTEADQGQSNWAIRMNSTCQHFEADTGCRFMEVPLNGGDAISASSSIDRRYINLPDRFMAPTFQTSISNTSYSTSTNTLNMSSLLSGQYPTCGIDPIGYTLSVNARDSGSAGTVDRRVEFYQSGMTSLTRPVLNLSGVPNDSLQHQTLYVPANANGSIQMDVYSSGTNTFDLTVRVVAIHM